MCTLLEELEELEELDELELLAVPLQAERATLPIMKLANAKNNCVVFFILFISLLFGLYQHRFIISVNNKSCAGFRRFFHVFALAIIHRNFIRIAP